MKKLLFLSVMVLGVLCLPPPVDCAGEAPSTNVLSAATKEQALVLFEEDLSHETPQHSGIPHIFIPTIGKKDVPPDVLKQLSKYPNVITLNELKELPRVENFFHTYKGQKHFPIFINITFLPAPADQPSVTHAEVESGGVGGGGIRTYLLEKKDGKWTFKLENTMVYD